MCLHVGVDMGWDVNTSLPIIIMTHLHAVLEGWSHDLVCSHVVYILCGG